jgi:hypothetical protein
MTARADIDALIKKADLEYRTLDSQSRTDFAGFTAMGGLTILAKHIDALSARLDALEQRLGGQPDTSSDQTGDEATS